MEGFPVPHTPDLTQSVEIDAPADRVFAMLRDLDRMREWSPECTGVHWLGSRRGAGARFVGSNRSGRTRWVTQGVVRTVEPPRFAYDIHVGPLPVSTWAYVVAPRESGCTVSESWTDRRPVRLRGVMSKLFGVRAEVNRRGIAATLANLKQAAEAEHLVP
jgi:uncharacterized protein YndB with AHSA1/START domain